MGVALYPLGDTRLEVYMHFCGSRSANASIEAKKPRNSKFAKRNLPYKFYFSNMLTMATGYTFSYPEANTSGDLLSEAMRRTIREALEGKCINQTQASLCWKNFCAGMKPEGEIFESYAFYNMSTTVPLNELEFDAPVEVKIEDGVMAEVVTIAE